MKKIKIYSWNVNGIRAVDRKGALQWFFDERPDILCLQETKAHEEQIPDAVREVDGYRSYFSRPERKGYSGVGVYSRIEPVSTSTSLGVERFDREGRVLEIRYDSFVLFGVYFPNGKASEERLRYKMDFYDTFLDHVNGLKSEGIPVVICGDVNTAHQPIDLARPKENEKTSGFLPEERAWIDRLVAEGFVDTFRMFNSEPDNYTWWDMKSRARDRNVGWRIDYFFVSEDLKESVKSAFIKPDIMGSDHCPVGIEITV
jgi:exodeoxyribonuclease-3